MAYWQSYLTIMIKSYLGDLGNTNSYTEDKIRQSAVVSAIMVNADFPFLTSYTYNLESLDIVPDPCDNATFDLVFIALITLKAACLLQQDAFQGSILSGLHVKDGDSLVDTTEQYKGYQVLLNLGPCKSYDILLKKQSAWASMGRGKLIVGGGLSHMSFLASSSYSTIFSTAFGGMFGSGGWY